MGETQVTFLRIEQQLAPQVTGGECRGKGFG